jgi:putative phage-type endonuclease
MALNLNYQPTPLVDTSKLTNDEWLDWRRRGIGGSDAAAALNQSPYRTARDLYYDKVGVLPVIEGEDKSITFEIGHLLEDVVAQIFAKKTGLTVYEDHTMYQHPLFPFMIADVDRFVLLPDGKKALLECKTAHYNNMKTIWLNGAVPKHYELQVKHYMAVMNIDTAFIACLFSNSESDFVWSRIDRDLEEEESTILQLQDFWDNYVRARVEPPLVEKPDLVLDTIRRYYGPADKNAPAVTLAQDCCPALSQICDLKEEKKGYEARVRDLDQKIKALYAPIVTRMGTACTATCNDGSASYTVTFNPLYREGISKDNLSALKAQYPEVYDDFVERTETRVFKITRGLVS